jgi:MFS transporter, DHA2 family, multidrug resistance protein
MDMTGDRPAVAARVTARQWAGLGAIALPCMLYSMDLTVLHLAIPSLTAALRPSATQLLWIIDIYGFFLGGFLIPMGVLGDRIGRRLLLMIGAAAFGAASLLAALSTTPELLIASRAVLGVAGATLAPSTLSLIRTLFQDSRQRTLAIAIWGSCFAVGGMLGPVLGGMLLEHFWWGSVFLIAVPFMGVLLLIAPTLLPESRAAQAGPLDLTSAVVGTAAVLAFIYGIKGVAENGLSLPPLFSMIGGYMLAVAFIRRQRNLDNPMLDLMLFRRPQFTASLVVSAAALFASSGSYFFVAQYLQIVSELSPLHAGMWLAPLGLVHLTAALLTPRLSDSFPPRTILIGGFIIMATGYGVLTQVTATGDMLAPIAGIILFLAGLIPVLTIATDLVISAAPEHRVGAASGISESSAELGASLGIAVLGSVASAIYQREMSVVSLNLVPLEYVTVISDTAAAGVAIAQHLPATTNIELLSSVREAFAESIRVVAVACGALSIASAVLCVKYMRKDQSNKPMSPPAH